MRSLYLKKHGDTGDEAGGHRDGCIAGHQCGDRQGLGATVVVNSSSSKAGVDRVSRQSRSRASQALESLCWPMGRDFEASLGRRTARYCTERRKVMAAQQRRYDVVIIERRCCTNRQEKSVVPGSPVVS